jgi:hypothetical protein
LTNIFLQELQNYNKYRISAIAFPNPEKEMLKAKMIHTLADAQASRKPTSSGAGSGGTRHGSTTSRSYGSVTMTETEAQVRLSETRQHKQKILKKPPQAARNFGGGKLGGESKQNGR